MTYEEKQREIALNRVKEYLEEQGIFEEDIKSINNLEDDYDYQGYPIYRFSIITYSDVDYSLEFYSVDGYIDFYDCLVIS